MLRDLRHGVRSLARTPGATGIAIVTLALGIGANTAVFSVVDAALFRPLAYAHPEELVRVYDASPSKGIPQFSASPPNYLDLKSQNRTLVEMAAFTDNEATLDEGGAPERLDAEQVSPSLFPLLGIAPRLGRTFLPAEERAGQPPTAILSWELWQRRFGGDPAVIGRAVRLDSRPVEIVGVMPRGFRFPSASADLWLPLVLDARALENRGAHWLGVIGRLRPGVALESAQSDLAGIMARLAVAFPAKLGDWTVRVVPLRRAIAGTARGPMLLLLGAVGLVLLLACVNVSNLLLARGASRRREVAIRTALGAARGRLLRQFLTESAALAAAGGIAGAVLAQWGCAALLALGGSAIPRRAEAGVDGRALLFAAGVSIAAALIAGLWPALRGTKASAGEALQEDSGRGTGGRRASAGRRTLLAVEFAMTLVLLAGAALLLRSMAAALRVDPGFRSEGVLTTSLALPGKDYPDEARIAAFYRELQQRLSRLPGVTAAGTASVLPMSGGRWWLLSVRIPDHPVPESEERDLAYRIAGGDFFRAAGIPLKRGRLFRPEDGKDAPLVAILNETAARQCYPGEDALGREIVLGDRTKGPRRIVGIVGDVHEESPVEPPAGGVYVPAEQKPSEDMAVLLRTAADPAALGPAVRAEIRAMDPHLPVPPMRGLSDQVGEALRQRRFVLTLLTGFAILALLLAAAGTYGVASCAAAESRREVGIRVALGARRADVVGLLVGDGTRAAVIGLVAGVVLAVPALTLLRGLLFTVSPADPMSFVGVALVLVGSAVGASLLPAVRAARANPVDALKSE